jgi:hypothetical protein
MVNVEVSIKLSVAVQPAAATQVDDTVCALCSGATPVAAANAALNALQSNQLVAPRR